VRKEIRLSKLERARQAAIKAWCTRRGPYYHISLKSTNKKTGSMVVTTSSQKTCPHSCPFKKNGCYADSGPLQIHWRKVTNGERGLTYKKFLEELRGIERWQET
jgi:hypothetical protein